MHLKLKEVWPGFCRVYYTEGRRLFCFQDDGSWGRHDWKLYSCSRDGEPSCEVSASDVQLDRLPVDDESSTAREFCASRCANCKAPISEASRRFCGTCREMEAER